MIALSEYNLTRSELDTLNSLLSTLDPDISIDQLWHLMDLVWRQLSCDNLRPVPERLDLFYRHPIWLLNGMFIEQHAISMSHRHAITAAVVRLAPQRVVDFGGGFGTLARLLAAALPLANIEICEPYPPRYGIESCRQYPNIQFVPRLSSQCCEVLVSTDVLEHVQDPLALLAEMVNSVRPGGHLLIANCFYPVIACHLPCTFHLRYSFDEFCCAMGLEVLGPCDGSHATIYRRTALLEPDWRHLRSLELRSKWLYRWRQAKAFVLRIKPWVKARLRASLDLLCGYIVLK